MKREVSERLLFKITKQDRCLTIREIEAILESKRQKLRASRQEQLKNRESQEHAKEEEARKREQEQLKNRESQEHAKEEEARKREQEPPRIDKEVTRWLARGLCMETALIMAGRKYKRSTSGFGCYRIRPESDLRQDPGINWSINLHRRVL